MKKRGTALATPRPRRKSSASVKPADLRKDCYSMMKFTEREVCAPGLVDPYVKACAAAAPLVEFLSKALGLRW